MANALVKNFDSPDETRPFEGKGQAYVVDMGGKAIGKAVFEPGWRWSENVKPIAKTDSCQAHHLGYCISGGMTIFMSDGTELEVGPGDVFEIPPGHDAAVTGDEPCVNIDFGGFGDYAKRQ
jgi:mannose-6-phosphate isomerase-like protein (cupin superfamily)